MQVIDYNLNAAKNKGKITDFNYTKSLNELVGTWTAKIAGGIFSAGDDINFGNIMRNGIISKVFKDADGLWHIEGKDAGVRLMRTTPPVSTLVEGNAKDVITELANFCDVPLNMADNGLSGFNVRSAITASTCAEAILELAMLSGMIAFIDNSGTLNVQAPSDTTIEFTNIIDDSGSDIDLDGYATQVTVIINRRREVSDEKYYYHYDNPGFDSSFITTSTTSDSIPGGTCSVTTLEPLGVIVDGYCEVSVGNVTLTTEEHHDYEYETQAVERNGQKYFLHAYCEVGYTLVHTTQGSYPTSNGGSASFSEVTTETMSRSLSSFSPPNLPDDWQGQLGMVSSEVCTRTTDRGDGNSPPFDSQITRHYSRSDFGQSICCSETETTYEARQIGSISPVKKDDKLIPNFLKNPTSVAIQTHSNPQWVQVNTYRTYYEHYDDEGNCQFSAKSEYCDDGAQWICGNGLVSTGDSDLDQAQEDSAKFSLKSHGLDITVGGGSVSASRWQFLEVAGMQRANNEGDEVSLDISSWYENGEYIHTDTCPHYNNGLCKIFPLAELAGIRYQSRCPSYNRKNSFWEYCERAEKALKIAKNQDKGQLEAPIIGIKAIGETSQTPAAGYSREIYIDDIISDGEAQNIANTIAENILRVKGIKGMRRTITIPYNASYIPNGFITEVSHNWANMQTSITYRTFEKIPPFLIPTSVAGIASIIADRNAGRKTRPMSGTILTVEGNTYTVQIGGMSYLCSSKLKNLWVGDAVLVSFTSGNSLRGQITDRL